MSRLAASFIALVAATAMPLSAGCGSSGGGPSSNADLATLTVSDGTLSPTFDAATIDYTVSVGFFLSTATVAPTAADAGASITVDGLPVASGAASPALGLSTGPNPVMVVVTAADGTTTKTYTVVFTRAATASQEAYIKASNTEAGDEFGWSTALSGDTLVVGARGEASNATGVDGNGADNSAPAAGAVYVFVRSGATWAQQAYLKASNSELGDRFGGSVSISGDTLVVGAQGEASNATGVDDNEADNSVPGAGAAYVFARSGATWTQQAYLKASNSGAGDSFGFAVSISGATIVVGAIIESSNATGVNGNQADDSASQAGAAYVFVRNGATWSQQAYLKASNAEADQFFGYDVGVSNDTIVVGGPREDSNATGVNGDEADSSAPSAGAAYVFVRSGTTWTQQAYLKASNNEAGDFFAAATGISDDTIVVGSYNEASNATGVNGSEADNSAAAAGAAYVFVRTGTTWTQQAYLKASNTETGDRFGGNGNAPKAVRISGDRILVSALQESSNATGVNGSEADNSAPSAGAAYVFVRSGGTWTQIAYLKASNTEASDQLQAPALSGDTVVLGARAEASNATGVGGNQADNSAPLAGAAYVLR